VKLKHLAKQVIEEKIQRLNEVDYEEIFSPETMSLLKKQSKDELVKTGKNLAQMINTSSTLIPELIDAEQPHIDLLEEIAKEIVTQAYPIIKYSKIKINASIGKGELPKGGNDDEEKNQPDIELPQPDINLPQPTLTGEKKRRIINGITQGASIRGTFAFLMFREYLDDLGEDMVNRYNEVMKSVFGIFDDENAIAMMLALLAQGQKSQGGESEAEFDEETGTLTINATAICFPMLVHEIVKGLYEILSLQGFGTDAEQNKSIVGKADQLAAEPNDMRFGKFIYDAANKLYIESGIEDDRVRDFFFTELYKIDDETEFIEFVENLVTSKLTSSQKKWAMDTMRDIERDLKADDAGISNEEGDEDVFTEVKILPGNTGNAPSLTSEEKNWIEKQLKDFDPGDTPEGNPDEYLYYNFIDKEYIKNEIEEEYMTSKDLEIFDSIYRKLKNKIYAFNMGYNNQAGNYPQLRDSVIKSETYYYGSSLNIMWSDRDDDGVPFGAFDKNTGKYIKYSDLGKVDEVKIQPKNTGVGSKTTLEFYPNKPNIKTISDMYSTISTISTSEITGIIKTKDLPPMFADFYIDKNELMMDLEVNSKHPERYDAWVKKLKSLNVPNDFRPPFISNINVEKYFNIKVNPI